MIKEYASIKPLVTTYVSAVDKVAGAADRLIAQYRQSPGEGPLKELRGVFASVGADLAGMVEQLGQHGMPLWMLDAPRPDSHGAVASDAELLEAADRLLPDVTSFAERARLIAAHEPDRDVSNEESAAIGRKLVTALGSLAAFDRNVKQRLQGVNPHAAPLMANFDWDDLVKAMRGLGL